MSVSESVRAALCVCQCVRVCVCVCVCFFRFPSICLYTRKAIGGDFFLLGYDMTCVRLIKIWSSASHEEFATMLIVGEFEWNIEKVKSQRGIVYVGVHV